MAPSPHATRRYKVLRSVTPPYPTDLGFDTDHIFAIASRLGNMLLLSGSVGTHTRACIICAGQRWWYRTGQGSGDIGPHTPYKLFACGEQVHLGERHTCDVACRWGEGMGLVVTYYCRKCSVGRVRGAHSGEVRSGDGLESRLCEITRERAHRHTHDMRRPSRNKRRRAVTSEPSRKMRQQGGERRALSAAQIGRDSHTAIRKATYVGPHAT